jgi:hypothetical protein
MKREIKYKIPRVKTFGFVRNARPSINTYKDFWDAPASLGRKQKRAKSIDTIQKPEFIKPVEVEIISRGRHRDGYVVVEKRSKSKKLTKKQLKNRMKITALEDEKPRNKQSSHFEKEELKVFTKKRKLNRFSGNPQVDHWQNKIACKNFNSVKGCSARVCECEAQRFRERSTKIEFNK